MKCKSCDAEIIRIKSSGFAYACNAQPVTYWLSNPSGMILTPNGERVYCSFSGPLSSAHGIGYTLHTCGEEVSPT